MEQNLTIARFSYGNETKTRPLYQYNYGQVLKFELDLPTAYEVHFANAENGTSYTAIGNADGVIIPDVVFKSGETIYAWVFLHEGEDDGETVYKAIIPIIRRAEPSNDIPTPHQQTAIEEAISALNEAVEKTTDDVATTEANAQRAESAKDGAVSAKNSALSAKNAAVTAKNEAVTARNESVSARDEAVTAKNTAVQSASDALESKNAAVSAADSASGSADYAERQAGYAKASEEAAEEYVTMASEYSSDAQTASEEADRSKIEAQNAAQQAQRMIGTFETFNFSVDDWQALGIDYRPYKSYAVKTAQTTIEANTIVELMNNNPVAFARYGLAIGAVNGQNITFYSTMSDSFEAYGIEVRIYG